MKNILKWEFQNMKPGKKKQLIKQNKTATKKKKNIE